MISIKPVAIAIIFVAMTSSGAFAQAQLSLDPPQPPPGTGKPDDRKPAGTRGPCEDEKGISFTPILPVNNSGFSGYTITGHPTFWFYIPYKTSSVSSGNFSIEDAQKNTFHRASVKLPNTPGFVSISIPTTEKPLEKNQKYRWNFTLYCVASSSEPPQVWHTGTIQRIDLPALEQQLKAAKLEERTKLYVANNIWYDAPTDAAKNSNPSSVWLNLVKVMGLEQLEKEPIAGSVIQIERERKKEN